MFTAVIGVALIAEILRWTNPETRLQALAGWMASDQADWLPFLMLLVSAPLWQRIIPGKRNDGKPSAWSEWLSRSAVDASQGHSGDRGAWMVACLLFLLALFVSRSAGSSLQGFPPAYHDEFSYLLQAQTYLAGRWWFPSHETHPEWFDQIHVLNEGKFASRYFPGTGFWMVPFVWLGDPWLGHQLAQALCAMLVFWIGRELSTNGVGLLAGILFAFSPGVVLFSELLLAHHPTMVGLLTFLWGFLRWLRQGGFGTLLLAGGGLAYAMICRPMTAAGFGLPFGLLFASWWLTGRPQLPWTDSNPRADDEAAAATRYPFLFRSRFALALAIPICIGFAIQMISNREITGSVWVTPYQLYTDLYTPRHRYGFNNVVIGEQYLGPKVLDNYDRWAENLTPSLAARNVWTRLENSLRWTMGIVPLLLGGLICLLTLRQGDRRWGLIWLTILSLHLVHVPYWFSGIMGWHYVFETAPLWLLIFAEGTRRMIVTWKSEQKTGLVWWWRGLIVLTLAVNLVTVVPIWPGRLPKGLAEVAFPRGRYQEFRQQVEQMRHGQDAIVFVIPDPADRHMDYVTNSPDLSGPVLVARIPDRNQLQSAAAEFPDRVPFVFDAAQRQLAPLRR